MISKTDQAITHGIWKRHIAFYLQGTEDKGLILAPDAKRLQLALYTDANFAGLFAEKDKHDPVSVKKGTGVLLNFSGVSIYWVSRLQS